MASQRDTYLAPKQKDKSDCTVDKFGQNETEITKQIHCLNIHLGLCNSISEVAFFGVLK